MTEPTYTEDWTTPFTELWLAGLAPLVGKPNILGLEVGCFEGRSSAWFLENILTDKDSYLVCVDRCVSPVFRPNMDRWATKCCLIPETSSVALPKFAAMDRDFDFAYLDACRCAACTLADGVMAFRLLKPGGVLIFDGPMAAGPRADGIRAFLTGYRDLVRVVSDHRQTVLIKTGEAVKSCESV